MYYEEKIIGGILHWRGQPHDEFQPYTLEALSARYMRLKEQAVEDSRYREMAASGLFEMEERW